MSNPTQHEINEMIAQAFANLVVASLPDAPQATGQMGASSGALSSAVSALVAEKLTTGAGGVTLGAALDKYWNEQCSSWAASSRSYAALAHRWLRDHFGASTALASIKKANAAEFREGLLRLESRSKEASFQARQTDDPSRRINPRTASKYLDFAQAFFNWAVDQAGLIEYSPFSKLAIKFPKKQSGAAQAATPQSLQAILLSPMFQGHHPSKLHQKGPVVARGDFYWAFVLQFYCGARIGEIAQLRVSDIRVDVDVPYVHFRKTDDQGVPINGNTLKTVNAERRVPICNDLIALGFIKFVQRKRGLRAYLFQNLAPSRGQKSSSKASKFGQRYLERIGQKSPRKATHWLRHAMFNALRRAHTPDYVINQIVGHAQIGTQALYGSSDDLVAAQKALDNADYQFEPLALLMRSKERWQDPI